MFMIPASVLSAEGWKDQIPVPVYDDEPGYVDLYWTAWEQAHDHIKEQPGLPQSPYVDEAFSDDSIWIWDTCFMVLFCKYAPDFFPGVETLNNFYVPLHDQSIPEGTYPLNIRHPDNPPLFAWVESDNFAFTGDTGHIRKLLTETQYLQKHFEWFDTVQPGWTFKSARAESAKVELKKVDHGYLWAGCSSGMDNTPRGRGLWIDAISQQALSALTISRMAEQIGQPELSKHWKTKYDELKQTINQVYWNEEDGIYYDVHPKTLEHLKVKTPASYWPMLAEVCSPEQAQKMVKHITDPDTFGGKRPWATVARDDRSFTTPDGGYWRGGIWLPTAYMGTKALEKYGFHAEADHAAENLLAHMYRTYKAYQPNTIWECYSPTRDHPVVRHNGHVVRPDFCGWSALGPISMFIENVLGFHKVDALENRVEWRLYRPGRHGIKKLKFADVQTDILYDGQGTVTVQSSAPYTLVINGTPHPVNAGRSVIAVEPPPEKEETGSLPVLAAYEVPQSVEELWGDYDPDREPLDVNVVREWNEDGCVIKYITYTIGTFKGEKSTMAAFYAVPENPKGKLPALIEMHGGGQRAMIASAKLGAENGYACLSINWGARTMEKAQLGDPNTDWGAIDATQTSHNSHYGSLAPDHLTIDPFESPRNNNWFLITLGAKRGVSFLQQQPEVDADRIGAFGHSMGGFLTVMLTGADPRIKAATPSCGGSGSAPESIRKRSNAGASRKHSDLYYKTIDDAQYTKRIQAPILYMGPQNDFCGNLDNMFANWSTMPSKRIGYTVNPHMNHRATAEHVFPSILWFDDQLKGTFDFPETPQLTVNLTGHGGVPTAFLSPDQIDKVAKVDFYYSVDHHTLTRFWRTAPSQRSGDRWVAVLPLTSADQPLYVVANVYYKLDHKVLGYPWLRDMPETFGITSEMRSFMPDELRSAGVHGDEKRERMIQAEFDYQDWYHLSWDNPHHWCAYTRKIKDLRFVGPDGAALALDVQVDHDLSFIIHVRNNSWDAFPGESKGDYYALVTVKGSPDWQTVQVKPSDFKPENSRTTEPLKHWRHVVELGLCARIRVDRDGGQVVVPEGKEIAWKTPRNFRNLRWVGGSWDAFPDFSQTVAQKAADASAFEDDEFQKAIDDSIALEKLDEASAADGKVYLSKEMAFSVDSNWQVLNDKGVEGKPISVGGKKYLRGLGVHAESNISFPLNGQFSTFHVVPGPDDAHHGQLEMKILVDGKEVYASGKVRSPTFKAKPVTIPVKGAKELTLIVTDGGDGIGGDHASWADAHLVK